MLTEYRSKKKKKPSTSFLRVSSHPLITVILVFYILLYIYIYKLRENLESKNVWCLCYRFAIEAGKSRCSALPDRRCAENCFVLIIVKISELLFWVTVNSAIKVQTYLVRQYKCQQSGFRAPGRIDCGRGGVCEHTETDGRDHLSTLGGTCLPPPLFV